MSDEGRHASAATETEGPDLSDGRYLYCVVGLEGAQGDGAFETEGVDGESVTVVTESGSCSNGDEIGAIVHACDALYDAADPRIVRQWLVQHQRVVDEAASQFGTPIPFQFDTILSSGDEGVVEWLETERDGLTDALDDVAGRNEYRIEVVRTEPIPSSAIERGDDDLATLKSKIEDASEGRAHLLRKQYDQRLAAGRRERDRDLTTELGERIDELVSSLEVLDRRPSISLHSAGGEDDHQRVESGETVCRFATLATDGEADELGSHLDSVADRNGIEVRFTGPWPPYSFVPSFDSSVDEEVS